ncbi:hypothetical protein D5F01_LYC10684, partial [Scomber scombrus]
QRAVPSYLLDYDLTGPGSQQWIRNRVPHDTREDECELLGAEVRSGTTTPISQISAPHLKVVDEEWEQMSKKMQDDQHPPPNQFPDPPIRWQQLSHENATLRHQASQVPELIVALKEMKQANTDLRQQVDDLVSEIRNPSRVATPHAPLHPRLPPGSDTRRQESGHPTPVYMQNRRHPADHREAYYPPTRLSDTLADDLSHLQVSHQVPGDPSYPPYSSVPPQARYPRADQYGQRTPLRPAYNLYDPQYSNAYRADEGYSPYRPY